LAEYEAAAWEYLLADPLGSVRQIANSSGDVTLLKSYEPYGSVLNSQGSATSIFGYAGEQIDNTGLIYLRARYMQPGLGIFLSRDPWSGDELRPGSMNGWNYGLGNPVKYTDPSGYIAQAWDFRVKAEDAGLPSERDDKVRAFRDEYWNYFGDFIGALGRESDFIYWMQESGRLKNSKPGNWWDIADTYLTASRFAGERLAEYIKGQQDCPDANIMLGQLEPGVAEWAGIILAIEEAKSDWLFGPRIPSNSGDLNKIFWIAHNSALREGVRRADALGLRSQEPEPERILMNYVLYDVLEPGDQCATGDSDFCLLTLPIELQIGTSVLYPWHYPAKWIDIWALRFSFAPLWKGLGAREPSPDIHLIDPSVGGTDLLDWVEDGF
jgi:RHS repeat-associated protein